MGWFSGKKSQATSAGIEAGQTARAQIVMGFILSEYMENGKFVPPAGLFGDPYVVGFLHGMIVTLADVGSAKLGKSWSIIEQQQFMLAAIEEIVGASEVREFVALPRKYKDTLEYKNAYFAANTYIKAIYAGGALTASNSVVIEATKLIEERRGFLKETFPERDDRGYLVWAIPEVSIERHIRATYLNN